MQFAIANRVHDRHRGTGVADRATANSAIPTNIVLNRAGAAALHFASPQAAIGKTVSGNAPFTVIGVVEDMRFYTPRAPIPPDTTART